jgi:hypothetical protein
MFLSLKVSVSFRGLVARLLGVIHGHEFAILGFAIPAASRVIDAAVEVDPHFAAGLGRRDVRGRRRVWL